MLPELTLDRQIDHLIDLALTEDLGHYGDLTSDLLPGRAELGGAAIVSKQAGIIAGLPVARRVFQKVAESIVFEPQFDEGAKVKPADIVVLIRGPIGSIMTGERTALNFLQRLSGIATLTSRFGEKIRGTKAKLLDTRKTTPALRKLEKYAVRVGGGYNHRFGLYDMILLKENHLAAAGGITRAVNTIRGQMGSKDLDLKIEVETTTLAEVMEARGLQVDRIMLDNFAIAQIREAVAAVAGEIELEVSGGVTLGTVREIAETGVDYISVGALTQSAHALDLSLLIESP